MSPSKIQNPKYKIESVEPYTALAEGYDAVMDHVDYDMWAGYVQQFIERYHPNARSILELGCGTGSLALRLQPRGPYRYTATDRSPDMLRVARTKAQAEGVPIRFRQMNFTKIEVDRPADVVLLLYDGMNYLLKARQVKALLSGALRALHAGGLFIFDQSTPVNSEAEDFEYTGEAEGFTYVRHSRYDAETRLHTTTLELRRPGGAVVRERHVQRAYTIGKVRRLIRATAFEEVAACDGLTTKPATDASARIHWVLRKGGG